MILILLFPSLIGGAIAGYVMKKFYEPMLLYTRFKHELEMDGNENQVDANHQGSRPVDQDWLSLIQYLAFMISLCSINLVS